MSGGGYRTVLASSVGERDGMSLELTLPDGEVVAEVFEEEETGERTVTLFRRALPLETLLWFLAKVDAEL
jgi:hypothetical protein